MMPSPVLLCCDMDRTVIPNGVQPESPMARPLFRALAAHPSVYLAYASGRHHQLVRKAIRTYQLPTPDYVITDVGTRIWELLGEEWREYDHWTRTISADWVDKGPADLRAALAGLHALRPQEPSKQTPLKLSYYVNRGVDHHTLDSRIAQCMDRLGIRHRRIWSMDEPAGVQLLDILPAAAGKLGAVTFLAGRLGLNPDRIVFAGDSGNDLEVLVSAIPSVLVANAAPDVRQTVSEAIANGAPCHLAKGGFRGTNGNYAAGVVEGFAHYFPELAEQALPPGDGTPTDASTDPTATTLAG
ncbi:MAG: HAD-IIB family hydrolase [Gammaproteobacteria bacterium]